MASCPDGFYGNYADQTCYPLPIVKVVKPNEASGKSKFGIDDFIEL